MIEDKLTPAQRIRLESLSQAIAATGMISPQRPTLGQIIDYAEEIEAWLKRAGLNS